MQRELLLQVPVVWLARREGTFDSLGVEAALNSIAKLGIVEILVGALRWFTVTEGRHGAHVQGDSPSTPSRVIRQASHLHIVSEPAAASNFTICAASAFDAARHISATCWSDESWHAM